MQKTDDIDFILTMNPHGWSICRIFIGHDSYQITITHVFGNPYYDFIKALSKLIQGQESASFFWYDEPGGEKFELRKIKDRQHTLQVEVLGFKETLGEKIKEFTPTVEFEIPLNSFLTIAYLQLKKSFLLMKDKNYITIRRNDFPFEEFIKFEKIIKDYLSFS
ncbi:MAG: hypothetical protein J7604_07260 [Sporocytophaga sp.]|uniref:hypothetical protein n=1 Tax=Sporocytophaga sp. TaxID=2231183 RepID=UPI001AFEB7C9|nr:hypothetical protein [Sporocytophaga sp.]MBO9699992.1 hypothetical protein [Sporocytophaga sp.]